MESPESHNQESKEDAERLADQALEMIKQSPDITFVVFGIGNVTGAETARTIGGGGYRYDYQTQSMVKDHTVAVIDNTPDRRVPEKPFVTSLFSYENEAGIPGHFRGLRIPLGLPESEKDNAYMTDVRGGVHLSLAIHYKDENLTNIRNDIRSKLESFDEDFYYKLLFSCARNFIPDYFKFILQLKKALKASSD